MNFNHWTLGAAAALTLAACGQSTTTAPTETEAETANAQQATETLESSAVSGVYAPDEKHRYITFSYMHQGYSRPWVRWRAWTGELNWDAETPENSSVSVTIDAAAVDSGVDEFDGHLQGDRFFDTANYPEITFVSTSVAKTGVDTGTIAGDLTIKGVTRPVTLDVKFNKGAYEDRGNRYKLGFSATASVIRSEFGMDFLVPAVSDQVDIVIETEWMMSAPASE